MNQNVLDAIAARRSVRRYTGEKVTREQLETILRAGMAAPSGMNRQPWFFVVIDDPVLLVKLSEVCPYAKMLTHAGAAIVVCGDTCRDCAAPYKGLWIQDCAAATENILLAVEALDLSAVWTAVTPNAGLVSAVSELLGLPENIAPFCVIPIGYPEGETAPKDKYDASKIHWNKF